MGVVLPFPTKNTTPSSSAELTPQEFHAKVLHETLMHCRELVEFYKRTGRWSLACESHMTTAVLSLKDVCRILAETPHAEKPSLPS